MQCMVFAGPGYAQVLESYDLSVEVQIVPSDDAPDLMRHTIFRLAPDGSFIVAPTYSRGEVAVFDPEGRYVRAIGREGRGPGELQEIVAFDISSVGVLAVADLSGQISLFDLDGSFRRSFQLDVPGPIGDATWIDGRRLAITVGSSLDPDLLHPVLVVDSLGNTLDAFSPSETPHKLAVAWQDEIWFAEVSKGELGARVGGAVRLIGLPDVWRETRPQIFEEIRGIDDLTVVNDVELRAIVRVARTDAPALATPADPPRNEEELIAWLRERPEPTIDDQLQRTGFVLAMMTGGNDGIRLAIPSESSNHFMRAVLRDGRVVMLEDDARGLITAGVAKISLTARSPR